MQTFFARSLHIQLNIDAIQQWPENFRTIVLYSLSAAATIASRVAKIAARAGIHRRDQLESRGKISLPRNTRYCYMAGLQWLTENVQNVPRKFRQFVKKQDPVMGTRYLAGSWIRSAADQRRCRGRVMWLAKGSLPPAG